MSNHAVRVLLMDEDPEDAELFEEMLRRAKNQTFVVHHALSLEAGFERLAEGDTDVVLLDLHLSDSIGLETFTRFYAHWPNIPIVVLSGLTDEAVALAAVRNGAQDFVLKGKIDGPRLSRILRYAIERKRLEESLRASENTWRAMVQSAPDIFMTIDRHGRILFLNRTVEGYALNKVIGTSVYDYVSPPHHEQLRESLARVFDSGEVVQYEIPGAGPYGALAWYSSRVAPIKRNGGISAAALLVRDITRRKQEELSLRREQDALRQEVDGLLKQLGKDAKYQA